MEEKDIPTTRSSTKIDKDVGTVKEVVFTIELDKLEGSSGTITLFLSDMVPFIKSGLRFDFLGHFRLKEY